MQLSRLRLVIITLILAAAALWLSKPDNHIVGSDVTSTTQLPYSWQTQNTTIWRLQSNQTDTQTIMRAERFTYQDENKRSDFIAPQLWLIDETDIKQLDAEQGHSVDDNLITFEKQVVVSQKSTATEVNAQQLQTERLSYNQKNNQLYSDLAVKLIQTNGITTAVGLEADLNTNQYHLLSNVQGSYDLDKIEVSPATTDSKQP